MLQRIKNEKTLRPYIRYAIEDAGIEVGVDPGLTEEEYIGIKVDDYYNGLSENSPKSVDYVVAVDCSCDAYVLYIIEMKNVNGPKHLLISDIQEKFCNTIEDFLKNRYKEIFLDDKVKYKDLKLYLVSDAYGIQGKFEKFEQYRECLNKINSRDTLKVDRNLSSRLFKFRNMVRKIEFDIPPNPIIQKVC